MKKLLFLPLGLLAACQPKENAPVPSPETPSAETPKPTTTQPKSLVGLTLGEASKIAESESILHRTIEIDGQSQPTTFDYRPERLNFRIKDGIVIDVTNG